MLFVFNDCMPTRWPSQRRDPTSHHKEQPQSCKPSSACLSVATDNQTTQSLIAKSEGSPPISLVKRSSTAAQEAAARALWHLASQADNRSMIVEENGIKPL